MEILIGVIFLIAFVVVGRQLSRAIASARSGAPLKGYDDVSKNVKEQDSENNNSGTPNDNSKTSA